jgi:hypothetical protein
LIAGLRLVSASLTFDVEELQEPLKEGPAAECALALGDVSSQAFCITPIWEDLLVILDVEHFVGQLGVESAGSRAIIQGDRLECGELSD